MARPKLRGVSYFPLPCDFLKGRLVRRLCSNAGAIATLIYLEILCIVYNEEGYYLRWEKYTAEDIANNLFALNVTDDDVVNTVYECIDLELFSREMFETYSILTSADIQIKFIEICEARNLDNLESRIQENYCLLPDDFDFLTKTRVSSNKLGVSSKKTVFYSPKENININENENENKSLKEEEQEISFIYKLFFRNIQNPNREYKKFKKYYLDNKLWAKSSSEKRQEYLDAWKQNPPLSPHFGFRYKSFLDGWRPIVDKLFELRAPSSVIRDALADDLVVRDDFNGELLIACSVPLRDYIKSKASDFQPLIESLVSIFGCSKLEYRAK